jgi:hypothetical protein
VLDKVNGSLACIVFENDCSGVCQNQRIGNFKRGFKEPVLLILDAVDVLGEVTESVRTTTRFVGNVADDESLHVSLQ